MGGWCYAKSSKCCGKACKIHDIIKLLLQIVRASLKATVRSSGGCSIVLLGWPVSSMR